MVIGGQAVIIYGEPRQTKDIDVTLGIDTDRYDVMHTAVKALELEILPDDIEQFIQQTRVLPTLDPKSGIRVDFIFSFSPYERQAIRRAHDIDVQNEPVRFATMEDVIIHKLIAGRARDIEDIKSILKKTPEYELEYIEDWLRNFDESLHENFQEKFRSILNELSSR